jgi:hypothetical protein
MLLIISSCINVPPYVSPDSDLAMCSELNEIGNITDLFHSLDKEVDAVKGILNSNDVITNSGRNELHQHAQNIEVIGTKINQLSIPGWTYENYFYRAYWFVSPKVFRKVVGPVIPSGFHFTDAEVIDVYYLGKKRDDMKEKISLKVNGDDDENSVYAEFNTPSSMLFECQLRKTVLITLKIHAKNLGVNKEYYVNLSIK